MKKKNQERTITQENVKAYVISLQEQEKSVATIKKYAHDLAALCSFLLNGILTKAALISWKESLVEQYAPSSVNTMLAAVNSFLDFCQWTDLKVKPLKIQKSLFCSEDKELTREEYTRLIHAAEADGNERISLVIQTICSTGIRVSELQFITMAAIQSGRAEINNKGKRRVVFLPEKLRRLLRNYMQKQKRTAGAVFIKKRQDLGSVEHLAGYEKAL